MKVVAIFLGFALVASESWAGELPVPSGRGVTLQEVIVDASGADNTYRFRFVTPDLKRANLEDQMAVIERDMADLCAQFALPFVSDNGDIATRIIISFGDRETEFGVASPEATQVFEIYSVEGNTCIWEAF